MAKEKKPMSNYVKYPLVLGLTCLTCGAILAGVNYFTAPVIAAKAKIKANQALFDILDADGLSATDKEAVAETNLEWDGEHSAYLNYRKKVPCTDSKTYFYYNATSAKGFSGTVTFGALVEPVNYTIIGYKYIEGSEDTIGLAFAKGIVISASSPYAQGGTIVSGSTASNTNPAMQKAFEAIIADALTIK
jgi:Na+-translocating ferredoxin:NAD+ oxidoreductase RnfG subunit